MVNVNKNIVPGKSAEKAEEKAPTRRPRNQALNSSKKFPDSIKNRRKQKLNCSREEAINQLVNEEQIYTQEEAEELIDAFEAQTGAKVERLATIDEVDKYDGEFWATKDGVTKLWCRGNGRWYVKEDSTEDPDDNWDFLDSSKKVNSACSDKQDVDSACGDKSDLNSAANEKLDGTITLYDDFAKITEIDVEKLLKERVSKMVPGVDISLEKINDTQIKVSSDCPEDEATRVKLAIESSDVTKSVDWKSATEEFDSAKDSDEAADSTALNSSAESEEDTDGEDAIGEGSAESATITTESGNEVSISDIQIIQNPDTNELSLFIKEDEDEEIPEGFIVIATATQTALPAGGACPNCGQEPCVCEDEGELDSSKKKN